MCSTGKYLLKTLREGHFSLDVFEKQVNREIFRIRPLTQKE